MANNLNLSILDIFLADILIKNKIKKYHTIKTDNTSLISSLRKSIKLVIPILVEKNNKIENDKIKITYILEEFLDTFNNYLKSESFKKSFFYYSQIFIENNYLYYINNEKNLLNQIIPLKVLSFNLNRYNSKLCNLIAVFNERIYLVKDTNDFFYNNLRPMSLFPTSTINRIESYNGYHFIGSTRNFYTNSKCYEVSLDFLDKEELNSEEIFAKEFVIFLNEMSKNKRTYMSYRNIKLKYCSYFQEFNFLFGFDFSFYDFKFKKEILEVIKYYFLYSISHSTENGATLLNENNVINKDILSYPFSSVIFSFVEDLIIFVKSEVGGHSHLYSNLISMVFSFSDINCNKSKVFSLSTENEYDGSESISYPDPLFYDPTLFTIAYETILNFCIVYSHGNIQNSDELLEYESNNKKNFSFQRSEFNVNNFIKDLVLNHE